MYKSLVLGILCIAALPLISYGAEDIGSESSNASSLNLYMRPAKKEETVGVWIHIFGKYNGVLVGGYMVIMADDRCGGIDGKFLPDEDLGKLTAQQVIAKIDEATVNKDPNISWYPCSVSDGNMIKESFGKLTKYNMLIVNADPSSGKNYPYGQLAEPGDIIIQPIRDASWANLSSGNSGRPISPIAPPAPVPWRRVSP